MVSFLVAAQQAMHHELRRQCRIAAGREPEPMAAVAKSKLKPKLTLQIVKWRDELHTFQVLCEQLPQLHRITVPS